MNICGLWKRFKLQYVTAIGGLALALGAAASLGAWANGARDLGSAGRSASDAGLTSRPIPVSPLANQSLVTNYYLVDSEEAAELTRFVLSTALQWGVVDDAKAEVVVVRSAEDVERVHGILAYAASNGLADSFQLIDLRTR
jgi:hypothetical protein